MSSVWLASALVAVIYFLSCVELLTAESATPAGTCTYNFDVWKPGEDVLDRITKLEGGMELMNATMVRDLARLRVQVISQIDHLDNVTSHLEGHVNNLQGHHRVRHSQSNMKYIPKKSELDSIWNSIAALTSKLEKISNQFKGKSEDGLDDLRARVGDLRAEWIVMKRELQDLRGNGNQLRKQQLEMGTTTEDISKTVKGFQSDLEGLERKQVEVLDLVRKWVRSRDLSYKNASQGIPNDSVARIESELAIFENKIRNLHAIYSQLDKKMNNLIRSDKSYRKGGVHSNGSSSEGIVPNIRTQYTSSKSAAQMSYPSTQRAAADNVDDRSVPRDCHDIYTSGQYLSGLYQIQPKSAPQLDHVYCEMINGTGWTVFQRRLEGLTNFTRGWLEYRYGFGNPYGEFWAGNDFLHLMTSQKQYILRIDLWDWQGTRRYAEYDFFEVGSEWDKYKLSVSAYQGNAGDSLSYHNGMAFSTRDADNDLHREHCAAEMKSGWWFNGCFSSNLNGVYHKGWYTSRGSSFPDGIVWFTMKESEYYSAKKVEMKLRPKYL